MVGFDEGFEVLVGEAYSGTTAVETDQVSVDLGLMQFVKLVVVDLGMKGFALPLKEV